MTFVNLQAPLRRAVVRSDTIVGIVRDSKKLFRLPRRIMEQRRHAKLIQGYLATHDVKKLHLGAGPNLFEGWLNTDLKPRSDHIIFHDITQTFPFDNATFDYVYSEHLIEHISWLKGKSMLRECWRVLKPGGTLRIATPDLAVIIGLYGADGDSIKDEYIRWITTRYLPDKHLLRASLVINNAFRNWGHQFLYDAELLELSLRECGFVDLRRYRMCESDDPNLVNIETHGKAVGNDRIASFETMVYEARRAR